ncbi:membrane protein [Streptomyces sp. NRRL S-340]|uniref:membrane protein n=1 Tax=Streptomyces sp. NRRL S-340 TaxID=1463901 RepID=UPI000566B61D|nr:membrane protein [Streptomyces sp. NRRL S-340]
MTSTTDTAGHPDVSEISDLTEGLLAPSRAEELRRHLVACGSCAEVRTSLEEIRDLLGTFPAPQSMPGDIADRIDAALAAEPSPAVLAAAAGEASEAGEDPRDEGGDDRSHVSRETPTAGRPTGNVPSARTGPGRKPRPRRVRRGIAALGAACTVAALGVATVVLASQHDDTGSDAAAQARPSASTQTFSAESLESQVSHLLGKAPQTQSTTRAPHSFGANAETGADTGADTGPGQPNTLKSDPTVPVPSCVRQGIHSTGTPLAAQPGTYGGKDAYLVVLSDPAGPGSQVTAYVVDASCVHDPSSAARVLLSHPYTRS